MIELFMLLLGGFWFGLLVYRFRWARQLANDFYPLYRKTSELSNEIRDFGYVRLKE